MSIGAIKESLFRTGADDVPQMSRVLGVLYLSGGFLVCLSLLLPHPEDAFVPGLLGIVGIGVVGGTIGIVWARHARAWMVHVVLAAGTFFICLADYFAGVAAGVYSAMFVWVVLMAASFFSRQALIAQVVWILVCWGADADRPRWIHDGLLVHDEVGARQPRLDRGGSRHERDRRWAQVHRRGQRAAPARARTHGPP